MNIIKRITHSAAARVIGELADPISFFAYVFLFSAIGACVITGIVFMVVEGVR